MFSMENSSCFFYVLLFCFMLTEYKCYFAVCHYAHCRFYTFCACHVEFHALHCTICPFIHTKYFIYICTHRVVISFFFLLRLINFRHEFRAIRFFYNTAKNETKTNCQQKHVYIVELTYCTI